MFVISRIFVLHLYCYMNDWLLSSLVQYQRKDTSIYEECDRNVLS